VRKVAVFGNAGGGKSILARQLAEVTRLPLFPIDVIKYREGIYRPGSERTQGEYQEFHADLLNQERWIIDGFDNVDLTWKRFAMADTLIYVDLPLFTHFRWITKRLIKGVFRNPEGWPKNTPIWSSTISGYRVLRLCHRHLTPKYRHYVAVAAASRRVHHLRSPTEIKTFLKVVKLEQQTI
jgi:adenylate kinase family enzyme